MIDVNGLSCDILSSPAAIGEHLAARIQSEIAQASADGRRYVLGCPAGRTPMPVYRALADRRCDAVHVDIVMMDEFVLLQGHGFTNVNESEHYSCIGFARRHILPALPGASLHYPQASRPEEYETLIGDLGGIDLFLVASGASDGHVAFNPPGTSADSPTRIVALAETTRQDNLGTFPDFASIDDTPTHGVSVGLGTIATWSRSAVLIMHGSGKAAAWRQLTMLREFNPSWPASIIFRCNSPSILIDRALADAAQ